jgi:outer membrane receptor protein involved in Fe transport
MNFRTKPPLRAVVGVFGIAILTNAWAGDQLDEVIVTAEKRSESLQTVPLSITAIGAEALQERAVVDFFDYGTKIPNLGFGYTGDGIGTSRTISIRGISGDNVTSIYLDETPLPDSIDPRILDIDHIEVLRGPQGTLYGARSMAGVVRIITKQPDTGAVDGFVHAEASDTWHTEQPNYNFDGAVNVPLVDDHAALRVSGFFERDAGYFWRTYCTNPATAGVNCYPATTNPSLVTTIKDQGATDNYGGSLAITVKASDALTITPRFLYQKSIYNGFPLADAPQGGGPAGFPAPAVLGPLPPITPSDFTQGRFFNTQEGGSDQWSLATVTAKYDTGIGRLISSTSYFSRDVFERENMSEWVWQTFLAPGVPLPGTMSEQKKYDNFVQEVRFASEFSGPWQFVTGAYFSDLHGSLPWAGQYPNSDMPGFAAAFPYPASLDPTDSNNIFAETYYTSIREQALFSETSYQFTSNLKGTVGLRLYDIDTTAGGDQHGAGAGGGPPLVDPDETVTARGVNPKGELQYQINHADMVYGLIAKGFRPGGLVPSVPESVCGIYISEINPNLTANDLRRYNSDSLWNYEVGAKTGWLDNRLTVNGSAFYIKWDNIQQWVPLPCGFQYRANAGAAVSKGFELEVHSRPAEGLDLTLGVGYNDARITASSDNSPQKVGDRLLQVPDWTADAAVAYTVPLSSAHNLVGTLDYGYVGSSISANNDPFDPRVRPSYEIVDARVALKWGQQELALVGKNLTNTHANLGDNRSIVAETIGRPRIVTNQPETFGVEFRSNF